jgi:hypothetical protein
VRKRCQLYAGARMRIRVSSEQIWMARVHPPRSTAEDSFRSPLAILPLMGGGGGSGIGRATLERSRLIHHDQRRSGGFRTPLAILPLMGGGGGSGIVWRVKWGPLLSCRLPCRVSLSATCIPLNRATGPFLIGCSLALLGFVPIGHLLTL